MKKSKSSKAASSNQSAGQTEIKDFLVVGIGASAGGINALKQFFENVPADSGIAYVVILHLSPDHDSQLAAILQTAAAIPVTQVTEKIHIRPDNVYVVPPNQSLKMIDGDISVSDIVTVEERRAPVDIFFRSLAESRKEKAVAVILSGTGANGSMGVKRVKEKGGVIFVQNPKEAEYSDMPRNSMATGLVDAVLPAAEIPSKIFAYQSNSHKIQIPPEMPERLEVEEQALREIFTQLRVKTGHDFTNYKRATVLRRIERRIHVRELDGLESYARYISEQPAETEALLRDLLISVTNFFRDCHAFETLESEIVPRILTGKTAEETVRVWVAGCATGEEAYSLAMLLAEQSSEISDAPKIQIFATDIDENAIAFARNGFYTLNDAADVSPERLHRFFTKEDDGFRVRREIREMILFAAHNLIKDAPFSRLDLVTCRNLLIYLNRTAQTRVMEIVHFALKPNSFLFLGSSESIDGASDLFTPVSKENNIFQSRPVTGRMTLPVPDLSPVLQFNQKPAETRQQPEQRVSARLSFADLHQQLLEEYAPPSVVINEEYDILHLSERAGRFLQIAGGEPSFNLLKVVRKELRFELRTALYQAVQRRTNVEAENLQVTIDDVVENINVHVRPVLREGDAARGFILVLFETSAETVEENKERLGTIEPFAHQLEEELMRTKAKLRLTTEQYETQTEDYKASNEELQATNEELRTAAEELETGKEELQSLNEELTTVNQELKVKIEEISQSNDDFQNLINSTDIGTIFLDPNLHINLYSPAAGDIFNFIPTDAGRKLSDITNRLENYDLTADAQSVLETLQTVEREVRTVEGRFYLMKIVPYRTTKEYINGVVITFVNISPLKQAEADLRQSVAELAQKSRLFDVTLSSITDFAYTFDKDGRFVYSNRPLLDLLGITLEEIIGKNFFDLNYPNDLAVRLQRQIQQVFETKVPVRDETPFTDQRGEQGFYEYIFSPVAAADGSVESVAGSTRDITERKKIEENLRQSEERLRLMKESASDYAIFTINENGLVDSWNIGAERIFGYTKPEIIGREVKILFTPEDRDAGIPEKEMKTAAETGRADDERWHLRRDGSRFYASGVMATLHGTNGFVKIARDMTDKINAEKTDRERETLKKLVSAQESERQRLARDLHDHLGQQLTALRLKLEAMKILCGENEELCDKVDESQIIARQIDSDVSFIAWELRPAALDDLGLIAALVNYVQEWSHHSGVPSEFHTSGLKNVRLLPEAETNLYRIVQEALNNVYKHANAGRVAVMLRKIKDEVVLIIEDDGDGFDVEETIGKNGGLGLPGMLERAALVGGTREVESGKGKGTTVFVRVPIGERGDNQQPR